jgi:hypothetical protein
MTVRRKARENGLVAQVCLVCLVHLVERNSPDEPDRRFTHKRFGSAIAAEVFMNNAG